MTNQSNATVWQRHVARLVVGVLTFSTTIGPAGAAVTALADQPIRSALNVPANVLLTLSVEYPTAVSNAHLGAFSTSTRYIGYFDPKRCYRYDDANEQFEPKGNVVNGTSGTLDFRCSSNDYGWSGSFLNWASMQTIDTFRWAMTGGQRVVDTPTAFPSTGTVAGNTVLQRAYASGQGGSSNFPTKTINSNIRRLINTSDISNFSGDLNIENQGQGNYFRAYGSSNGSRLFRARVKVCVKTSTQTFLEDNCQAYPDPAGTGNTIYKPVGLIQKNAGSMRFGAFGYLNDSNLSRDGGVLRAPLRDVMSAAAPEIYPTGAFVTDALATDPLKQLAANTQPGETLIGSGVIQYLNRFGNASNNYKTYDPVGEMYAEAIKYYKGLQPTSSYVSLSSTTSVRDTQMDGFPVFKTWNDPVTHTCQKNFIVGIGDVNTHADKNLNGNPTTGGKEPARPADLDTSVDVHTWTDTVGGLEGLPALASAAPANGCCNNNGFYMAGLAYYANTQDIRSNLAGTQTVQTYWVDVLEFQTYKDKNQYWLATKYGGFKDAGTPNNQFDSTDIWNAEGRTHNSKALPDNYFVASNPDKMVEGLNSTFASIRALTGSQTLAEFSSSNVASSAGSTVFATSFDTATWTSKLTAQTIGGIDNTTGTVNLTPVWEFGQKLAAQTQGTGWDTGRFIATYNGTQGIPFRLSGLATAQANALGTTAGAQQSLLNYLRGDKSNEANSSGVGGLYRHRASPLSDIVDSQPVYVPQKPEALYSDLFNPGYSAFVKSHGVTTPRGAAVYVGSNGGMLHAINATTGNSGIGQEYWAYVPSLLFAGPSTTTANPQGTPTVDGLAAIANKSFAHHYYVNATPVARDVDFARTANAGGQVQVPAATVHDWRTILVGGLGKGGRGFYALDITTPSAGSETVAASKVLWEFTDKDMGFSYGKPLIVKTKQWGWVVIVTSGYNNTNAPAPATAADPDYRGKGILYVLNAKTGALLAKIPTSAGSAADPSGLTHVAGFTRDYSDYTVESVYGGDLLGNLWRFDLTRNATFGATPTVGQSDTYVPSNTTTQLVLKFAELKDATNTGQPVTSAPLIYYDPRSLKRWVFVGTGKLLDPADATSSQTNYYYAFRDGSYGAPYSASTLPANAQFPLGRSLMQRMANNALTSATTVNSALADFGWYIDFSADPITGSSAERVIANSDLGRGFISFATTIPSNDPCKPDGNSRFYAIKIDNPVSLLKTNTSVVSYIMTPGATGARVVRSGTQTQIVGGGAGSATGASTGIGTAGGLAPIGKPVGQAGTARVINWRVVGE